MHDFMSVSQAEGSRCNDMVFDDRNFYLLSFSIINFLV